MTESYYFHDFNKRHKNSFFLFKLSLDFIALLFQYFFMPKLTKTEAEVRRQKREHLSAKIVEGHPPKKFSDAYCLELGQDLLDWLDTEEGQNATMFVDWYSGKHGMFLGEWKDLCDRKYFAPFYERARKKLAQNMMQNKDLHQSYGHRYLALYDQDLDAWEEHKADKQSERRIREKKKEQEEKSISLKELAEGLSDGKILEKLSQTVDESN